MGAKLLTSEGVSSYGFSRRNIEVDTDYTVDIGDDTIFTTVDGITVTLCDSPFPGKQVLIVAVDSICTVSGGLHEFVGGPVGLPVNGRVMVTFAPNDTWIITDDNITSQNNLQTEWWVKQFTGNDANSGLTSNKAIKTFAQLFNRWGTWSQFTSTPITVHCPEGMPDNDPFHIYATGATPESGPNINIIMGDPTRTRTGTIQTVTLEPKTIAPTPAYRIKDPGVGSWANDVKNRIRITSGPRMGAEAVVARDLTGNVALCSNFVMVPVFPDDETGPNVVPQPGDKYEILKMDVPQCQISIGNCATEGCGGISVTNGYLVGATNSCAQLLHCFFNTYTCRIANMDVLNSPLMAGSQFSPVIAPEDRWEFETGNVGLNAGATFVDFFNAPKAVAGPALTQGFLFVDAALVVRDRSQVAVYAANFSGGNLECFRGGTVINIEGNLGGKCASDAGVTCQTSGRFVYNQNQLPTITGQLYDWLLATSPGDARQFVAGAYGAPVAQTWAALAALVGNKSVHSPTDDSHIIEGSS